MRFGEYLADSLKKAGFTQRSFASKVKYHQQNFNQIVLGKRAPPLKCIAAWAAQLKGHIDSALFLELAELEHTPEGIRKLVKDLQDKVRRLSGKS